MLPLFTYSLYFAVLVRPVSTPNSDILHSSINPQSCLVRAQTIATIEKKGGRKTQPLSLQAFIEKKKKTLPSLAPCSITSSFNTVKYEIYNL